MSTNPERGAQCPKCGEAEHPMVPAPCRYNGWTNYETWAVHLWLSNDQGTADYWRGAALDAQAGADLHNLETYPWVRAKDRLADRLKDEIEGEVLDSTGEGMAKDLVGAALCDVDWTEIAEAFLDA